MSRVDAILKARKLAREKKAAHVVYHNWDTNAPAIITLDTYERMGEDWDIKPSEVMAIVHPHGLTETY
jgi:hypothetical protein